LLNAVGIANEYVTSTSVDHTWESPELYPAANGNRYQYGVDNG